MFRAESNRGQLSLWFNHVNKEGDVGRFIEIPASEGKYTECLIYADAGADQGLMLFASGYGLCHPNDNYSRAAGREWAMVRALVQVFPPNRSNPQESKENYNEMMNVIRQYQKVHKPSGYRLSDIISVAYQEYFEENS